ncbi:MAG: DNA-binding response regulator, partial [Pseudomonadota bacterium]|nr:DNA-binding response regulator [Pseudomonadota bacterium]
MQLAHKIIVADDHPLFRTALQQAVSQIAPDAEIVQAESLPELQTVVEQHSDTD